MNRTRPLYKMWRGALAGLVAGGCVVSAAGYAAAAAQAPGAAAAGAQAANTAAATRRPLGEVLERMSRDSGWIVVADSRTAAELVAPPAEPTTAQNVEAQIAALVEALPRGATWARLYLPAPPPGARGYSGDAVAEYAAAQARLFGRVGDAPAGQVEVMGRNLSGAAAAPVVSALGLTPVYLVTNPNARPVGAIDPTSPTAQGWTQMTPEQRAQFAQAEAQRLLNMDPAARQQYLQQQNSVMRAFLRALPREQRGEFFRGMWGGGRERGGGNRGGGGGRRGNPGARF
jgi:hypothetical protein